VNNDVIKTVSNVVIDHFDGQVVKVTQSVPDETLPLIDLSEFDKHISPSVVNVISVTETAVQREILEPDTALITNFAPASLDLGLKQTVTASAGCEQVMLLTQPDCASKAILTTVSVETIEKLAGATSTAALGDVPICGAGTVLVASATSAELPTPDSENLDGQAKQSGADDTKKGNGRGGERDLERESPDSKLVSAHGYS
jgi:hypothetical protein